MDKHRVATGKAFVCASSNGRRHTTMAQQGGGHGGSRHSQNELYSIPAETCSEFAEFMDTR